MDHKDTHVTTDIVGTIGPIAPEYISASVTYQPKLMSSVMESCCSDSSLVNGYLIGLCLRLCNLLLA